MSDSFDAAHVRTYNGTFIKEPGQYRSDLVHVIASIVFESLSSIANAFDDFNGRFWHHCISVINDIYPFYDTEPAGLNPLQQQLAVQLIEKLRENMEGFYPSISKVLLATIGPYDQHPNVTTSTAYSILRDSVYKELQKLPNLYMNKPDKLADFLPANVIYSHAENTLTHLFRGGQTRITNLSALSLPDINLYDEGVCRTKVETTV